MAAKAASVAIETQHSEIEAAAQGERERASRRRPPDRVLCVGCLTGWSWMDRKSESELSWAETEVGVGVSL